MTNSITQNVYTHILSDAGNEKAGKELGAAIEQEVVKAENSVTLSAPEQKEPPVEIPEALENVA